MKEKQGKKTDAAQRAELPEPQRLDDVLRALTRHRTTALIFEHLGEYVASTFRGDDARGPRKLLALPDGSRYRAAVEDVRDVEIIMRRLAADAREKVGDLHRAPVLVDRSAVVPADVPAGIVPPPPVDEGVVDSAPTSADRSASGQARRSPPP